MTKDQYLKTNDAFGDLYDWILFDDEKIKDPDMDKEQSARADKFTEILKSRGLEIRAIETK